MKTVLIFSGYNVRAVFAFIRTLESHGLSYAIIARSAADPIFRSTYRSKVVATRSTPELEIGQILDVLSRVTAELQADNYVIAPSTEALNRFLLDHRQAIESLGIEIPLPDDATYLAISDKSTFLQLCVDAGIDVPRNFPDIDAATLPFVAKPTSYVGPVSGEVLKPVIIESQDELNNFRSNYSDADFFYQEFVAGGSYYLLYYFFGNGDEPLVFSQENLVQQQGGESILAAVSSDLHNSAIAKQYQDLFIGLGFSGLVMVEVRGTKTAARMIEANPRFWGPSQLFLDAGVNFFEAFLSDIGFDVSVTSSPAGDGIAKYFWDDGASFNDGNVDGTAFHNYSASQLEESYESWDQHNIFKKPDTMQLYSDFTRTSDMARASRLAQLRKQYSVTSKHSNYQILAPQLQAFMPQGDFETHSRYEDERFSVIRDAIDLDGTAVLDIGGNTGYFTFEALAAGASVTYFDGNQSHADFVATAGEVLNVQHRLNVRNRYYLFDGTGHSNVDVVFLLNVLHHVGDDYGDARISIEKARQSIIDSLVSISRSTRRLVFQLGFNWKGDTSQPLFKGGTKQEMIDFLRAQLSDVYEFDRIEVADVVDGQVVYEDVDDINIQRRDDLGEFLNRPLVFMTSKT